MAVDKRFWSGAIIVATVAISGAGALPALLLRPAAPEAAPFETAVATMPADPKPAEPLVSPPAPAPEPAAASAPVAAPAPVTAPAPVAAIPPRQAEQPPPPVPEPPRQTAMPESFPPVQPVDIATQPETEAAATPAPTQSKIASAKPASVQKTRIARESTHGVKRKRSVRPAAFPIREFLAWRR